MLREPMTHPRSLAQAPFGWAQDRWDRWARMGHPGGRCVARLKSCPGESCPDKSCRGVARCCSLPARSAYGGKYPTRRRPTDGAGAA